MDGARIIASARTMIGTRAIVPCIRKGIALLLTLFIVSVMTFVAFCVIKGDAALMTLGTSATAESAAARRQALGTDKGLISQYTSWMRGLLHGDMGTSIRYKKSVSALMMETLPKTLMIGGVAFLMAVAAGVPLGVGIAYARGAAGAAAEGAVILCLSVPEFFLSVIVICIFSLTLHLFVPGAAEGSAVFFAALVIAVPQVAMLAKFVSAAITNQLGCLYVRTARGQGASARRILLCHVLPNALVSILPLAAMMAANIFTGSVVVEQVFGIAGVGRLLVGAVLFRDLPLCRVLVLCIATVTAVFNFAVDAVVRTLDTRVKLGDSG